MRLAQEEARDLNYNHVGTEAILLALVRQQDGTAGTVLASLGITLEGVRAQLVGLVFPEEETVTGHIPFTPRAKKSLELALRESLGLRSEYIGTGHILLGLLSQSDSIATRVLNSFEPDSNKLREAVLPMLSDPEEPPAGRFANRVNLTMVRDTPAVAAAGPDPGRRARGAKRAGRVRVSRPTCGSEGHRGAGRLRVSGPRRPGLNERHRRATAPGSDRDPPSPAVSVSALWHSHTGGSSWEATAAVAAHAPGFIER
jgi:hypothetical protein